jgi:hypothetical protein
MPAPLMNEDHMQCSGHPDQLWFFNIIESDNQRLVFALGL